jgi:DNA-binding Lrp family transcriptional regulator
MGKWSDDISKSVFRRTVTSLSGQISMSSRMLDLLILLDGRNTIGEVSHKLNMSMSEMRPFLSKLQASGVIEEVQAYLEPQFLGYLVGSLSRIAGPIARMMVEDAVLDIAGGSGQVPQSRAGELIETLARQIPNQKQKTAFIQEMLGKLKES